MKQTLGFDKAHYLILGFVLIFWLGVSAIKAQNISSNNEAAAGNAELMSAETLTSPTKDSTTASLHHASGHLIPNRVVTKQKYALHPKKHKISKQKFSKNQSILKSPKHFGKKRPQKPSKNFIELDWMMVGIVGGLGIGLFILLWILMKASTSLSLFGAILVALGFAMAIFFWMLANTENDAETAAYEYFIKFGIFAWVGLLLLLAGLLALFGGTPNVFSFLIIGLILGAISLIIGIIKGNSILNELFPYWIK
jgi:hypothetical protein